MTVPPNLHSAPPANKHGRRTTAAPKRVLAVLALMVCAPSLLTVAQPVRAETEAAADPLLSEAVQNQLVLALEDGRSDLISMTVKLAAAAIPGSEAEILALAARTKPEHAATVAVALGLRPRSAEMAVAQARVNVSAAEMAAEIEEDQKPRFFSFEGWDGRFAVGTAASTGNTRETDLSASLDASRNHGKLSYELALIYEFAKSDGERTRDRYSADLQTNYAITDRLYIYSALQGERDEFDGFDYRATAAPGLGYWAVKREKISLRFETGPAVRFEEPEEGTGQVSVGGIASSRFKWTPQDGLIIQNDSRVIATENTTLRNLASITVPVYANLSLQLSNEVRYDLNPPQDTEALDTSTRATVAIIF